MVSMRVMDENEKIASLSGLGFRIDRASETLPQGADGSLFTISGGRVLMLLLVGEVTVVIAGANASLIKFNPTATGADQDLCAALDITTDAVGTQYTITGIVGNAMRDDLLIGQGMTNSMILSEGVIELECAGSVTGETTWSIWYVPLDRGAKIEVS